MMEPFDMTCEIVRALDGKRGKNIKVLKTRDLTVLADYFVICTAGSTTQIKTLSDEVQRVLDQHGEAPHHTEGYRSGGWVLLDYSCVVVHLFLDETREFYSLERLWSDAEDIDISDMLVEEIGNN